MRQTRLYLPHSLTDGQHLQLASDQSHYLCRVLRLKHGQPLSLNSSSGWPFLRRNTRQR